MAIARWSNFITKFVSGYGVVAILASVAWGASPIHVIYAFAGSTDIPQTGSIAMLELRRTSGRGRAGPGRILPHVPAAGSGGLEGAPSERGLRAPEERMERSAV